MTTPPRRRFFKSAAAAGVAAFAGLRTLPAADAEIQVDPSQPGALINPHIYGHFIEHLGGVIYDGIWVGRNSKVPNLDGIRKQFVDDLKRIGAPNLRWPGGCFADGYHWRDGIGATAKRPRTYNYWEHRMPKGLHAMESNEFGIHEFMRCAGSSAPSRMWRPTSARGRRRSSMIGCPIATPRGEPFPWPTSAPGTATTPPSTSSTGASATSRGAAAATCPGANTPPCTASTSRRFPST